MHSDKMTNDLTDWDYTKGILRLSLTQTVITVSYAARLLDCHNSAGFQLKLEGGIKRLSGSAHHHFIPKVRHLVDKNVTNGNVARDFNLCHFGVREDKRRPAMK